MYTLRFSDGSVEAVSITGCPDQAIPECRVKTAVGTELRWIYNPGNADFQKWMIERLGGWMADHGYDGVFLDGHGPGVPIEWPEDAVGGRILEYDLAVEEAAVNYNSALVEALDFYRTELADDGKFIFIYGGPACSDDELFEEQIIAAGGTFFNVTPAGFDGADYYRKALDRIHELAESGVFVNLHDSLCGEAEHEIEEEGFTPGNYATSMGRWNMWRLASYYLAREKTEVSGNTGTIYFDANLCIPCDDQEHGLEIIDDRWLRAYEAGRGDPGRPAGCR